MAWKHTPQPLAFLSVGLFLKLLLVSSLAVSLRAETIPLSETASATFIPDRKGAPKDSAGGASRDGGVCPNDTSELGTSVTPFQLATNHGFTVAERPTFFVYIPPTVAQDAVFILKDETEEYFYQKTVSLPNQRGLVSFKLPLDAPTLEIGKTYQWSFLLICGQSLRPDSPKVEGQIQRIQPDPALLSKLQPWSPVDRAAFYGEESIQ
ncbi:DUF928 domain-containing protein [Coleofasciculus sp. E2-BRE-01]|uniref:DUF928 domain-containing protein n=1 Tax=Coleofasciculus sp. E2-BRE-01 TaxID=3069524 RepID=UPI0032FD7F16